MSDLSDEILPQDIFEGYGGDEQRLFSYATLIGVFNLIFAVFLLVAKAAGRPIPERVDAKDIVLLGVATHKLSQIGPRTPLQALFAPLSPSYRRRRARRTSRRSRGAKGLEGPSASC